MDLEEFANSDQTKDYIGTKTFINVIPDRQVLVFSIDPAAPFLGIKCF